jgi:hypothetical protein
MSEKIVFVNNGLSQQSFRLRPYVNGVKVPVRRGVLVVVPGRDPKTHQPGRSAPVDKDLFADVLGRADEAEWLVGLIEDNTLTFEDCGA